MRESPSAQAARLLVRQLISEGYTQRDVEALLLDEFYRIPATAFDSDLSPLETLAKVVPRDQHGMLGRSASTMSQARKSAEKKHPGALTYAETDAMIPLTAFADTPLSVLETVCSHLRNEHRLRNNEIAELIGRDEKTVWTCLDRADKKRGEKHA